MINSANCGVKQGTYYSVLLYGSVILGSGMSIAIVTACTAVIIYEIKLQQRRYTQRLNQIQSIAIPETSDQNNTSVRSTNGNTLEAVHTRQRVDTPTATANGRRTMSVKGSMSHQNEQLTELRNLSASISVIFVVLCGTSQALSIYSH
ncbi:uncharacterized protein LOC134855932, partial [Symsagittifera roscoffensis]|uniref:uncharacterized protein LOC134855932 n=1 Tax=Symsagittifera roscoffensis TaxID=84072 RepID=UPI00307C4B95